MKKISFLVLGLFLFFNFLFLMNNFVNAQVCDPSETCFKNPIIPSTIWEIIERLTNYILVLVISIAIIMILVGAYYLITAMGDPNKIQLARRIFLYVAIGVIVALVSKGFIALIHNLLGG